MKRMRIAVARAGVVGSVFLACSGAPEPGASPSASVVMRLTSDGVPGATSDGRLFLGDVPFNPTFKAYYPNPWSVRDMSVEVARGGRLVSRCSGPSGGTKDGVACREHPFFARVERGAGAHTVIVFDVHGDRVGSVTFPGDTGDTDPSDERPGGGTSDGAPAPGGSGGGGADGAPGGGASPGGGAPGPGASNDGCVAAREAYCARVNAELVKLGISATVDCSTLDGGDWMKKARTAPPLPSSPSAPPCHDVTNPADQETLRAAPACFGEALEWGNAVRFDLLHRGLCLASPLVVDLDGDGVRLGPARDGVEFDLFGTGTRVRTAWPLGDDAFLALDRDGDGRIDGARELFGDFTAGRDHENGFAALAELDANRDGVVDERDPAFGDLRLWRDRNRDGVGTGGELAPLRAFGIGAIVVRATRVDLVDAHGNRVVWRSDIVRRDGSHGVIADVFPRVAR
jgi:hypothetical protein